jgi:hypothetical protein
LKSSNENISLIDFEPTEGSFWSVNIICGSMFHLYMIFFKSIHSNNFSACFYYQEFPVSNDVPRLVTLSNNSICFALINLLLGTKRESFFSVVLFWPF